MPMTCLWEDEVWIPLGHEVGLRRHRFGEEELIPQTWEEEEGQENRTEGCQLKQEGVVWRRVQAMVECLSVPWVGRVSEPEQIYPL